MTIGPLACELFDLKQGPWLLGVRIVIVVVLGIDIGLYFENTACRNFQTALCLHEKVIF